MQKNGGRKLVDLLYRPQPVVDLRPSARAGLLFKKAGIDHAKRS